MSGTVQASVDGIVSQFSNDAYNTMAIGESNDTMESTSTASSSSSFLFKRIVWVYEFTPSILSWIHIRFNVDKQTKEVDSELELHITGDLEEFGDEDIRRYASIKNVSHVSTAQQKKQLEKTNNDNVDFLTDTESARIWVMRSLSPFELQQQEKKREEASASASASSLVTVYCDRRFSCELLAGNGAHACVDGVGPLSSFVKPIQTVVSSSTILCSTFRLFVLDVLSEEHSCIRVITHVSTPLVSSSTSTSTSTTRECTSDTSWWSSVYVSTLTHDSIPQQRCFDMLDDNHSLVVCGGDQRSLIVLSIVTIQTLLPVLVCSLPSCLVDVLSIVAQYVCPY